MNHQIENASTQAQSTNLLIVGLWLINRNELCYWQTHGRYFINCTCLCVAGSCKITLVKKTRALVHPGAEGAFAS